MAPVSDEVQLRALGLAAQEQPAAADVAPVMDEVLPHTTALVVQEQPAAGARKRESTPAPRARKGTADVPAAPRTRTAPVPGLGANLEGVADRALRAGFRMKVYGILAAQMILTVAVAIACTCTPPIRAAFVAMFNSNSDALQLALFIPTLSSLLCLQLGAQRHYPWNYILLFVFTFCMSVNVGYICTVFQDAGLGWLILEAFAITAVIFVTLTSYALHSGKDFSYMRAFLTTMLLGLAATGFVGLFFPAAVGGLALASLGALTFCGFILYDTWRIEKLFSCDDYIPATIELYLDIINLFLYILKILHKMSKKDEKRRR